MIRTAFIYKPATVELVGALATCSSATGGLRQRPRAARPGVQGQAAAPTRTPSPSSSTTSSPRAQRRRDRGRRHRPGQRQRRPGRARPTRWSTSPTTSPPTAASTKVFLAGDFNSYTAGGPDAGPLRRGLHQRSSPTTRVTILVLLRRPGRLARPRARPTRRPGRRSPAPTSGRSTPRSRWPSSTAATTTTPTDFYAADPFRGLRPRPGDRRPRPGRRRRPRGRADPRHQRLPRPHPANNARRRGRARPDGRRGQAAARRRTRTPSSPPPVT